MALSPFDEGYFATCDRDEHGWCIGDSSGSSRTGTGGSAPAGQEQSVRDAAERLGRYAERSGLDAAAVVEQTRSAYERLTAERAANPLQYSPATHAEVYQSVAGEVVSREQERNRLTQREAEAKQFAKLKGEFEAKEVSALPDQQESQAAVKVVSKRSAEEVQRMVSNTMGRDFPVAKFASLVGAPSDAIVTVTPAREAGKFTVRVKHPDYVAKRTIGRDYMGRLHIHNDEFFMRKESQGKGLGKEVFTSQVTAAAKEGFEYIETYGAGNAGLFSSMNGYYTWPRFGYDQKIDYLAGTTVELRAAVKEKFPGAESIADVMLTEAGRSWWKTNGSGVMNLKFDLAAGSRSMKILGEYLAEKPLKSAPAAAAKFGERGWQNEEIDDIGNGYENPDAEEPDRFDEGFFATCDRDEHGWCVGEGGSPEKTSADPASPGLAKASAWLASSSLPDAVKSQYAADMGTVLDRMQPGFRKAALDAIAEYGGSMTFHADTNSVTAAAEKISGKKERDKVAGFASYRPRGDSVKVHLDGADETGKAQGVYAHELGHAADVGEQYSADPKWQAAWKAEIKSGKFRVSPYAELNAKEGFAEFHRALVMHGAEKMAAQFPRSMSYLKSKGLV